MFSKMFKQVIVFIFESKLFQRSALLNDINSKSPKKYIGFSTRQISDFLSGFEKQKDTNIIYFTELTIFIVFCSCL